MSKPPSFNDVPPISGSDFPSINVLASLPVIKGYKILKQIGEGGMGIVYLAEQKEPIKRKVALKVIKPGMDSKQVIARFESESQALALLDHPNIAHIFEGGVTEAGLPYFVMEYIKGLPITEYCDQHKLSIEERLELFQKVCEAIQYAHQKGIIHRDIKPSNILVSTQEDKAIPKIIDFGIAKAINQPLTERTLITEQGLFIGTPEYISPEQANLNNEDIDHRSDVYSLGVLLYELLTGTTPFDKKTLRRAAFNEITRIIREEVPPRPSTRLLDLGEEAAQTAINRRTDVRILAKQLHKELEWIPLKAIRKERNRRYKTTSELVEDVQNYLNARPLIAGPDSANYLLRKAIQRHKHAIIISGLILLNIICFVFIGIYIFANKTQKAVSIFKNILFLDDFDDGFINSSLWKVGGGTRGWQSNDPIGSGGWSFSHQEIIATDGYLNAKVWGPTSDSSSGAEAWIQSNYNFNDGKNYLLNFTWEPTFTDFHYNHYFIQITNGFIPKRGDAHWSERYPPNPPITEADIVGTMNLLWNKQGYRGWWFDNTKSTGKLSQSITIDSSGTVKMYSDPNAGGALLYESTLNKSCSWFVRFMVTDATSDGFSAGDASLKLYSFVASFEDSSDLTKKTVIQRMKSFFKSLTLKDSSDLAKKTVTQQPAQTQRIVVDFEQFNGINQMGFPEKGTVPDYAKLYKQLLDSYGVIFTSGSPFVVVFCYYRGIPSGTNYIWGSAPDGTATCSSDYPIKISFFKPGDSSIPAYTNYVSVQPDLLGNGKPISLKAYDLNGDVVAECTKPDSGLKLEVSTSDMKIHYVKFFGHAEHNSDGVGIDDLTFNAPVNEK
jgi:serine/threonine protein kinase